jgi:hypothetical protein
VRHALGVKQEECRLDIRIDPRLVTIRRHGCAGVNHLRKCRVGSDAKPVLPDRFGERLRHAKIGQRQDRSLFWFDPISIGVIARIGHREHPVRIAAQQQVDVDGQAASDMFWRRSELQLHDIGCWAIAHLHPGTAWPGSFVFAV